MEIQQLHLARHFLRIMHHVYLDHNATTRVSRKVVRRMNRILKYRYGNPSSLYALGRKSNRIIEDARRKLAQAINSDSGEIYFTGCATESNNAVLKFLSSYFAPHKNKIISLPIEHPSILNTLEFLKSKNIVIEYCPVDRYGRACITELEKMIDDKTFLICCMLANNEIGTIQDVAAITSIAEKHNVLVLSDCVQALGKIPVDVHALGVHYASFSAHKLNGPKGIGALYVRQGSPIGPFLHGGHQERGMRAGTESLHNIAGFGAACSDIDNHLARSEKIAGMKRYLIEQLHNIKSNCIVNSPEEYCLNNTLSITFPGIKNAELMMVFDNYGISVSAGSACSAQDDSPSKTLRAIGLSDRAAQETIRFSLDCGTSKRDIRYTAKIFRKFCEGDIIPVKIVENDEVDEKYLFDENRFILDVRPQFLRKIIRSLPNSHEMSFASMEKQLKNIPRDKEILVVCHTGDLSYIVAFYLKSQGFERIGSLRSGVLGWKAQNAALYDKFFNDGGLISHSQF